MTKADRDVVLEILYLATFDEHGTPELPSSPSCANPHVWRFEEFVDRMNQLRKVSRRSQWSEHLLRIFGPFARVTSYATSDVDAADFIGLCVREREKVADLRAQVDAAKTASAPAPTRQKRKLPEDGIATSLKLYFENDPKPTVAGLAKKLGVSRAHLSRSISEDAAAKAIMNEWKKERESRKQIFSRRRGGV